MRPDQSPIGERVGTARSEPGPSLATNGADVGSFVRANVRGGAPYVRPALLVVGASTGGPQALVELLAHLAPVYPILPVCVTLHMPREFMPVVAGQVATRCRIETRIVEAPCRPEAGVVHFAPGDKHLDFHRTPSGVELSLRAAPSGACCRPAIDTMFQGAARAFGSRAVGVVLSGMGEDGLAGAHAIVAAGGLILVQDKTSSAVWGMPGAVVKAGLAAAVLKPNAIAHEIVWRLRSDGLRR